MVVCKSENCRAQLCVMAYGRLADQELADTLTDLVCDVRERLPAETPSKWRLEPQRRPRPPPERLSARLRPSLPKAMPSAL